MPPPPQRKGFPEACPSRKPLPEAAEAGDPANAGQLQTLTPVGGPPLLVSRGPSLFARGHHRQQGRRGLLQPAIAALTGFGCAKHWGRAPGWDPLAPRTSSDRSSLKPSPPASPQPTGPGRGQPGAGRRSCTGCLAIEERDGIALKAQKRGVAPSRSRRAWCNCSAADSSPNRTGR